MVAAMATIHLQKLTISADRHAGTVGETTPLVHARPHGATPANHARNSTLPKLVRHTLYPPMNTIATEAAVDVVAEAVTEDVVVTVERVAEAIAEVSQRERVEPSAPPTPADQTEEGTKSKKINRQVTIVERSKTSGSTCEALSYDYGY